MKRAKLLVGVLVASIALLGTGYAYWTDQLTVNATVTTGELKVVYNTDRSAEGITGELNEVPGELGSSTPLWKKDITVTSGLLKGTWYWYGDKGGNAGPDNSYIRGLWLGEIGYYSNCWFTKTQKFNVKDPKDGGETVATNTTAKGDKKEAGYITEATAIASEKGLEITIKNFYPGSFATATFEVQNVGTIPAVLNEVLSEPDMSGLEGAMQVVAVLGTVDSVTDVTLEGQRPVSEIADVLADLYANAKLEPTEKMETTLIFVLPGAVDGFESNYDSAGDLIVNKGGNFELEITWTQHNALTAAQKAE